MLRAPASKDLSFSLNGQPAGAAAAPTTQTDSADATKSYVASLLLLFPIEAVTLFPLGQSIAGDDARALTLIIFVVTLFVATLRYFGTKDPATGAPAKRENRGRCLIVSVMGGVYRRLPGIAWRLPSQSARRCRPQGLLRILYHYVGLASPIFGRQDAFAKIPLIKSSDTGDRYITCLI